MFDNGQNANQAFPSIRSFVTNALSTCSEQLIWYGLWKQLLESVETALLSPIAKYSSSGTWNTFGLFWCVFVFPLFVEFRYVSSSFVPFGFSSLVM